MFVWLVGTAFCYYLITAKPIPAYIFVGSKEREKYGDALNEEVLNSLGEVVFQDEEYSTYILKVNK